MIKRIVFFIESPLTKRDYNRFGTEILINNGFIVEFWDFTPFINPLVFAKYTPPDKFTFEGLKLFYSKSAAIKSIKKLSYKETLVVTFLDYQIKTLEIYQTLSFRKILYGTAAIGSLPSNFSSKRNIINYLLLKLSNQPLSLIRAIFNRLTPQWLGVKPMNFVLLGGERAGKKNPTDINTEMIHACTFDYDLYLQEKFHKENEYEGSIVFLDVYLPFHSDYLHMGVPAPCKPEEYYPPLVNFFETIESALNSKVVIAAHPRSSYENHPDYFGGRKVLRGLTSRLVKQSKCVIAHGSTALNFAVIYEKPVLFVTLNILQNYKHYQLGKFYELMANTLGNELINLDEPRNIDWQAELEIDHAAYKMYRDSYIKSPLAPEKPCWQIFADYVKTIK
ncbi:hypothetical protein AM228_10960 [Planktothricoides sp. SR001]|uniref:hypothetical protein n=1 Tax=Planktothricoides sp. SR001 TaxID=1705388 RepID=UPI0006C4983E|nr:hypothetical protein [Planktothricoides sp. SR001]KOR36686.1 hypothetical protein AM228_10960 [Planktothricoides sp. SR001]